MAINHKKVSDRADGGDPGDVNPSNWNDDHNVTGLLGALLALGVRPSAAPYLDADGSGKLADLTPFARSLLALSGAADVLAAIGGGALAPLSSPQFTGIPTAPTAALGTATTQIATMGALQAMRDNLVNAAPGQLDTLRELADALGDDPNFAASITAMVGGKQPLATMLTNLVALASAADKSIYFTAANAPALMAFTAFARTFVAAVDAATARTALGLGTAALADVGTGANQVIKLDGAAKLPAVDGSQLTNVSSAGSAPRSSTRTITAADAIVAGDEGHALLCSGTFTLGITEANVLGASWSTKVKNYGSGIITLGPYAGFAIDGRASLPLFPGEAVEIFCNGSGFRTLGRSQRPVISRIAASNLPLVDFTSMFTDLFEAYEIIGNNIYVAAGGGSDLFMRVLVAGVQNSSAGNYRDRTTRYIDTANGNSGSNSNSQITLNSTAGDGSLGNGSDVVFSFKMIAHHPSDTTQKKRFNWDFSQISSAGITYGGIGAGFMIGSNAAYDGLRFFGGSGNVTGDFTLIGIRNTSFA